MKNYFLWLLLLTALSITGCKHQTHELLSPREVTEVKVTFLNLNTGRGDESLKTITTPQEVSDLIAFTNAQVLTRSDFKSGWDSFISVQDRSSYINASFYASGEYKGTIGLGNGGSGKSFLLYYSYSGSKPIVISSKEKEEFLKRLHLSETEYQSVFAGRSQQNH